METLTLPNDADELAEKAIALVENWITRAKASQSRSEQHELKRLSRLISDKSSVQFTMRFCDRVARPDVDAVAATQLARLARSRELPSFLSRTDKLLFRIGGLLAPKLPRLVMPLARVRMRQLVGHLLVNSKPIYFRRHLKRWRNKDYSLNINLLGESILGDAEANRRLKLNTDLLEKDGVEYISIKVSAVCGQLNLWAYDDTVSRVAQAMREIYRSAIANGHKFVNLDMEEYRDLRLTIDVFMSVLSEREFHGLNAGIVLQAYVPDSYVALQELTSWANDRHKQGGGWIKIRIVKGANLAMETVDAKIHGWPQATYGSKIESDANYKRLLDWIMYPERMTGTRLGVASHNLFDVAWALLLSRSRNVSDRVDFEMLQGMAPNQAEVVRQNAKGLLLYTPTVANKDFDTAVGYLFRRLEENSSEGNFLRDLFSLDSDSDAFSKHREAFTASLRYRGDVDSGPYRVQNRNDPIEPLEIFGPFKNEPDTDPASCNNRNWIQELTTRQPYPLPEKILNIETTNDIVERSSSHSTWGMTSAKERREILLRVAHEMASRRGEAIATMCAEANKIRLEADTEVSEAIDFARYYAEQALSVSSPSGSSFEPLGVVLVAPPWNFPFAIAAGGVLAALAAGNSVILKPSPNVARCGALIAECCWSAGIPKAALQLAYCEDGPISENLLRHELIAGVILTGALETAELFHSWRPNRPLFAETSGKNALVITPHADIDLAVSDLVKSAFGHAGQKCSAASLAICVGDVYYSTRLRRQLLDATRSLRVGPASAEATTMSQLIGEATGKLLDAFTTLGSGEEWLLKPVLVDSSINLWSPGIKLGVKAQSKFHMTECFGPVLGLMHAASLDEAIELQNSTPYGLTAGIHTLDDEEIDHWQEQTEAGNLYINRSITGAIVQRQPFGGWKRSAVGPGAKAGGPNYVGQLGTWRNIGQPEELAEPKTEVREVLSRLTKHFSEAELSELGTAAQSDAYWWTEEFSKRHDPTNLDCESNVFQYRPRKHLYVRVDDSSQLFDLARTYIAAKTASVELRLSAESSHPMFEEFVETVIEDRENFRARMKSAAVERIRWLADTPAEFGPTCYLDTGPALMNGRVELLRYVQEQSVSRTLHRFGNLSSQTKCC